MADRKQAGLRAFRVRTTMGRTGGRRRVEAGQAGKSGMIDIKKRLEEEIRTLDYELKVTLPKEIQKAREYGDLRENAEYKAAKERQTFLQARISQLQMRMVALSMINLDK